MMLIKLMLVIILIAEEVAVAFIMPFLLMAGMLTSVCRMVDCDSQSLSSSLRNAAEGIVGVIGTTIMAGTALVIRLLLYNLVEMTGMEIEKTPLIDALPKAFVIVNGPLVVIAVTIFFMVNIIRLFVSLLTKDWAGLRESLIYTLVSVVPLIFIEKPVVMAMIFTMYFFIALAFYWMGDKNYD